MREMVFKSRVLCRGNHTHPRTGACLVEFAGALPGGRWTDHPAGVQPVLAALARAINDATTDEARMALLPWAPWLVGTAGTPNHDIAVRAGTAGSRDHDIAVRLGAAGIRDHDIAVRAGTAGSRDHDIAVRAGAVALRHAGPSAAQRLAGAMAYVSNLPEPAGKLSRWRQTRAAAQIIRTSVAIVAADGRRADETLRTMLTEAVNLVRERDGLVTVDVPVTGYRTWPATQPIRVELCVPDGSESRYEYCAALPDDWPPPLAEAWAARLDEISRRDPVPA
jgi:hypothetical protein